MANSRTCLLIRRHPFGGFCVLAMESDNATYPAATSECPSFDSISTAAAYGAGLHQGKQILVHPECDTDGPASGGQVAVPATPYALDTDLPFAQETPEWVRLLKDWTADTGNPVADDMRREAIAASDRVWGDPHLRALVTALQRERERGQGEAAGR